MPSTIPYDPSLTLGNLVGQEKLKNLVQMSENQAPADAAEDTLNSFITLKNSLDMTVQEMINMEIDPKDVIKEGEEVNKKLKEAAIEFAKKKIEAETKNQPLRAKIMAVNEDYESPIDYNKSEIKKMPLSSDSLKMNVQYFAVDENEQNSETHASTIKSFVSGELSYFGNTYSAQASAAAQSQVSSQQQRHSIEGTLVISISCTHKDAAVFAPFILDVDKGIRVWNKIHTDDMIKTDSITNIMEIAKKADTKDEKSITLLSGATYGSSFVGMVHILNTTNTTSSEKMYSLASSMQTQFEVGGWFAKSSGGFGVDGSFSQDVKNLLSSQNISSHCTLTTMGSIPSIKSNEITIGVKAFADDDGAKSMAALQKIQNATAADQATVSQSANAARTGSEFMALKTSSITAALSALNDIETKNNKILDINSMMAAMDDYIDKCLAGNLGVPINYYLKPIGQSQLAKMWMSKYYPGKFLEISGDDSEPVTPAEE